MYAKEDKPGCNNRGRSENSEGFSDYTAGLNPDTELKEDLSNLGVLGDINEPLLAKAIEGITGESSKRDVTARMPIDVFIGSEMFAPSQDNMFVNSLINEK